MFKNSKTQEKNMRAFIGIEIPEELKQKIIDLQEKFEDFDIKFVEKENLHFNLKFLGETDEEKIEKIKKILKEITEQFESFEVKVHGMGVFPNKNYIRVVWLGVKEGYQQMLALAESVENAVVSLGFEKGKFEPHLTLGRVRSGRNRNELLLAIRKNENADIGSFKIKEIKIIESKLSPKGPVYEEIFSAHLRT